eukprot:6188203-Pleurochrysis_carterae.AAC.2
MHKWPRRRSQLRGTNAHVMGEGTTAAERGDREDRGVDGPRERGGCGAPNAGDGVYPSTNCPTVNAHLRIRAHATQHKNAQKCALTPTHSTETRLREARP